MRPSFGWPIAIILSLLAMSAMFNGEAIDDWVRNNSIVVDSDEPAELVGVAEHEKWFVVLIDFPDQDELTNCDQERASNLLDDAARNHIRQGISPTSELTIVYHNQIITTNGDMSDYGYDEGLERDVGKNGYSPHTLGSEIAEKVKDDVEWNEFDLNDDGWVDRFLILHCIKPQEDSGPKNAIWSHFSSTEEIVESGDFKISHYTIASQRSSKNLGTIIHEMYHQFGGVDLYPVHDQTVNQVWKGVDAWDIMASGNWNGNGAWPALPTTPMAEMLGGERHQNVELDWPEGQNCEGPIVSLTGISEGGYSLKIPIGDEEYIWIEYRSDSGFDSHLPGNGLLVLQQDLRSGEIEDNHVNTHPDRAWLKVIEADGNQDMVAGRVSDEGDVFWDGGQFGSEGITIRNRDGVKVDWVANVSVVDEVPVVTFSSEKCGHSGSIDLPDRSSVLIPDSDIEITLDCDSPQVDLTSSDGRAITVTNERIIFDSPGLIGVIGVISGTIECGNGTPMDIRHEFEVLGNIPIEYLFESEISVTEMMTVEVPIDFIGSGEQTWLLGVDGPLSRIAEVNSSKNMAQGDTVILEIDPGDLLVPNMLVRGELILASNSGHQYVIEIELSAEAEDETLLDEWRKPSILIPIALCLAVLWVVLGIRSPAGQVSSEQQEDPDSGVDGDDPAFVDPFSEPY